MEWTERVWGPVFGRIGDFKLREHGTTKSVSFSFSFFFAFFFFFFPQETPRTINLPFQSFDLPSRTPVEGLVRSTHDERVEIHKNRKNNTFK